MQPLRVLVATDGRPPSTRAAQLLVALMGGREVSIRLLSVASHELYPRSLASGMELDDPDIRARLEEHRKEAFDQVRTLLTPLDASLTETVRFGNAAEQILLEIEEWDPGLVVLGKGNTHGATRWIVGSVSTRVLHHTAVPALVVS